MIKNDEVSFHDFSGSPLETGLPARPDPPLCGSQAEGPRHREQFKKKKRFGRVFFLYGAKPLRGESGRNFSEARGPPRWLNRRSHVALTHHDLAQGCVEWSKLGTQQLTSAGLKTNVHVVSNASDEFLRDLAFAKNVQAKIILVADDTCARLRASSVSIVECSR